MAIIYVIIVKKAKNFQLQIKEILRFLAPAMILNSFMTTGHTPESLYLEDVSQSTDTALHQSG
jgi:hypothetical protein